MINGEIAQSGDVSEAIRIAVIDIELLQTKRKFLKFISIKTFSKLNARVIEWVRKNPQGIDEFEIGVVGLRNASRLLKDLQLNIPIKKFLTEESYKNYLVSRNLFVHLAIQKRDYYTRRSIEITTNSF